MNKKLVILICLFIFGAPVVKANEILEKDAKLAALNFYTHQYELEKGISLNAEILNFTLVTKENVNMYYVANMKPGGFVLLSAHKNIYPVLAYSTDNLFDVNEIPAHVQSLLTGYEHEIVYSVNAELDADSEISSMWNQCLNNDFARETKSFVSQFVTSNWGQGPPYNLYCPEDEAGPGGHAVAGCPSIAMGQLMFYYRYPNQGIGSNSYIQEPYGVISADFENAYYDYNAMSNVGSYNSYEDVAELVFHAGVAISSFYSASVSGVYTMQVVEDALINNFAFSETTELVYKTGYSWDDWHNMIQSNLDQHIPVIYTAVDLQAQGGHTWLIDGYMDDFYHMNFGWNGAFDGNYYLDDISVAGYNFDSQHQMIMNVYPAADGYPNLCQDDAILTTMDGTITDNGGPYIYSNNTNCSWMIDPQTETDSVTSITVNFQYFNTEAGNDIVNIYDVLADDDIVLIASLSGEDAGEVYTSSGNRMYIEFTTNSSVTEKGWMLNYKSNRAGYCNGFCELTEPTGILTDGSGDFHYSPGMLCTWIIEPENAVSVTANFISLNTELNSDMVKIYDGFTLIGTYSGASAPLDEITAESGKMMIRFTSNQINNFDGWELEYSSATSGVDENSNDQLMQVFPNPTHGLLKIKLDENLINNTKISIYNVYGKKVYQEDVLRVDNQIDCSKFSPGVYVLKLEIEDQVHTQKIIIE